MFLSRNLEVHNWFLWKNKSWFRRLWTLKSKIPKKYIVSCWHMFDRKMQQSKKDADILLWLLLKLILFQGVAASMKRIERLRWSLKMNYPELLGRAPSSKTKPTYEWYSLTHKINEFAWYIYLHLVDFYAKSKYKYTSSMNPVGSKGYLQLVTYSPSSSWKDAQKNTSCLESKIGSKIFLGAKIQKLFS